MACDLNPLAVVVGKVRSPRSTRSAAETVCVFRGKHRSVNAFRLGAPGARYPERPEKENSTRLHDVLEAQARKMAQSLHDQSGQLLALVYLKLDEVAKRLPESHRGAVSDLRSMLNGLESELRRLSHELRPTILDDLGLVPAVNSLKEGITARSGLAITVLGGLESRCPSTIETAMYRAIHGTLLLAQKARARRVILSFAQSKGRVRCVIREEGGSGSLRDAGILSIRDRVEELAGTLSICTDGDRAVEVAIQFPVSLEAGTDQGLTRPRRTAYRTRLAVS